MLVPEVKLDLIMTFTQRTIILRIILFLKFFFLIVYIVKAICDVAFSFSTF